jgi:hypothetical protein
MEILPLVTNHLYLYPEFMLIRAIWFLATVTAVFGWIQFSLNKGPWVMFAGMLTLTVVAELTGEFVARKTR